MQITTFCIAYTKKSTTLPLWVLIIRSVRVVCKLQIRLLSSSLGNTVVLHTLFLEYETQIGKKKYEQCFSIELQFTCVSSDKSKKNRKTA